jgi:uncharacterized protein (TIRG00374 family)
MLKNILKFIAISGVILFVFYFVKAGPHNIWLKIKELSVLNFFILMLLRLAYWSIRSLNWFVILIKLGASPGFSKVLIARLGGHSVGYLTPTAKVGGEVVRVFLLETVDKKKLAASVVIDKMIEFLSAILVVSSGVITSILILPVSQKIKAFFLILTIILFLLLSFFFMKQIDGFFLWFTKNLRIGRKYFRKKENDIIETDKNISEFYKNETGAFIFLVISNILNYILWIFEIYITMKFLGSLNITLLKSYLIATLGSFAFLFPLFPGSLGIFEATYIGLFRIFYIDQAVGIGYIITRRILGLIYAGIGLFSVIRSGFTSGKA